MWDQGCVTSQKGSLSCLSSCILWNGDTSCIGSRMCHFPQKLFISLYFMVWKSFIPGHRLCCILDLFFFKMVPVFCILVPFSNIVATIFCILVLYYDMSAIFLHSGPIFWYTVTNILHVCFSFLYS